MLKKSQRVTVWSIVVLIFAYSLILGNRIDRTHSVFPLSLMYLLSLVIAPIGGFFLEYISSKIAKISKSHQSQMSRRECIIVCLVLFVCWFIVLLGVFPGFFCFDATDELNQVLTRQFSTHHPLFHVLYLAGSIQLAYKIFGSYNIAIFLFTLAQMTVFSVLMTYVLYRLRHLGLSSVISRILTGFLALFPVFPMIVLCSVKDSLFSFAMLLGMLKLYEFIKSGKRSDMVIVIVSFTLSCLLRNNASYALIASGIIWLILSPGKVKSILMLTIIPFVLSLVINMGLIKSLNASDNEHQEILTVPIQQLSRSYNMNPGVYTSTERDLLYKYIPEEYINNYRDKVSDYVKIGFQNDYYANNKGSFFTLWFNIFKKDPTNFIDGWLLTNYGFWYPYAKMDAYVGHIAWTYTITDINYYAYETEYPGTRQSLIPAIDSLYRKLSLETWKEKIPVVNELFSPGFMFWIWIFIIAYLWTTRGKNSLTVYIFPIMVWCTLLLGPTYVPRYVFYLWLCLPILLTHLSANDEPICKNV